MIDRTGSLGWPGAVDRLCSWLSEWQCDEELIVVGRAKSARVQEAQRRAQEILAAEAAQADARRQRIELAVAAIWKTLELRETRGAQRDVQMSKLQERFDTDRAKITAGYEQAVAQFKQEWAAGVLQLRTDGKSANEIAALTGLTAAEVRDALSRAEKRGRRSRPRSAPTVAHDTEKAHFA